MGLTGQRLIWALCVGSVGVFLGERVFQSLVAARVVLSGAGLIVLAVTILASLQAWRSSEGEERRVAGLEAMMCVGGALAVLGFLAGSTDGVRWLGMDFDSAAAEGRFRRGLWSVSGIVLGMSILPALGTQWALRAHGRSRASGLVEARRIYDVATGALTVALAAAFLMLTGYIASARDWTFDASYFKTSSPGGPVQEIVRNLEQPLQALLFFPDVSSVGDQVEGYFRALEGLTDNVVIESYDRLMSPDVAERYQVTQDGTVVLLSGTGEERLSFSMDLDEARSRLRVLDGEAQQRLLMLTRERHVLYLTTGHGELNDVAEPEAPRAEGGPPPAADTARLPALRRLLGLMNYEVRDLGVLTGLAGRIPDDAAAVLAIGPRQSFLEEEMGAIAEYLERGGSVLLAVDPTSDFELGEVGRRLGVRLQAERLADDRRHMRRTGGLSDRRLIVSDRISLHPSVSTAARQGRQGGVLFVDAGSLLADEAPDGLRTSVVLESLPSTFADLDGDLQFDDGPERRESLALGVATEGVLTPGSDPMRALVYADSDLFSDDVLGSLAANVSLVADGVRWLGREEEFSGATISEADTPIAHTQAEDAVWFYALILGAPGLVLALGLGLARRRGSNA